MTGGGSGGHVYPLLAVAEAIRALDVSGLKIELHYLGPKDDYEPLFENLAVSVHELYGAKLRRYASLENLVDAVRFPLALLQAFLKVFWIMPDVVYSKGGPGALPVVFAAWFFHIPILIHESDTVPGLTNKISAKFAKRIAVSFESAMGAFSTKKTAWTGHPERRSIRQAGQTREAAKSKLGFLPNESLVVVVGGSQGSQRLNGAVLGALPQIADLTAVLHQAGPGNADEITKLAAAGMLGVDGTVAARHPWKVMPYLVDIGTAFQAADLIISRAGSGSIFEIASFGRAAVLVPLPESAHDHQRMNAIAFMEAGACAVIEEGNLVPGILARQIEDILTDTIKRQQMETKSRAFSKEGAADVLASELLSL